ncbi:MAG: hypothetical protein N838_05240 [Thiohalocapsa sp. PB-PSB1]|nr:MAG: hypothetical protein N838_05240 [Thiohalocapsa sp. PB-PSB1]
MSPPQRGGDDRAPAGNLVAHEFGRDRMRQAGAERLAAVLTQQFLIARIGAQFVQTHVLADGHVFHLGRDDAFARIVHLSDVGAGFGAAWRADVLKAQRGQRRVVLPPPAEAGAGAVQ